MLHDAAQGIADAICDGLRIMANRIDKFLTVSMILAITALVALAMMAAGLRSLGLTF